MKTISPAIFVLFILFPSLSFSQSINKKYYEGALYELYFNRQPSAKAEAMGKGLVTNTEADFGAYYNPALTSLGSGVVFNASRTFIGRDETTSYGYIGIGYSGSKLGSFSISRYNFATGISEGRGDKNHNSIHTLNYSRELARGMYAGANINLVHMGYKRNNSYFYYDDDFRSSDAFTLDIGILKKFDFGGIESGSSAHSFQIGAAIYNVSNSKIENKNTKSYEGLPIILRAGISLKNKFFDKFSKTYQLFTMIEFESVLNSQRFRTLKIGEEIILEDVVVIRTGFTFSDTEYKYGFDYEEYAHSRGKAIFSLGAGLRLPLKKVLNSSFHVNLSIDYTPSVTSTTSRSDFKMVSVSLNCIPN